MKHRLKKVHLLSFLTLSCYEKEGLLKMLLPEMCSGHPNHQNLTPLNKERFNLGRIG
jgi:hypothetical protein